MSTIQGLNRSGDGTDISLGGKRGRSRLSPGKSMLGLAGLLILIGCMGPVCANAPLPTEEEMTPEMAAELNGSDAVEESGAPHQVPDPGPSADGSGAGDEGRPELPASSPPEGSPPPAETPNEPTDPDASQPNPRSDEPDGRNEPAPPAAPAPSSGFNSPVAKPTGPVPQTQLKPIARWDTVPYQRINADGVLNAGVVAFSKYGISHVRFIISGQGYSGPSPVDVEDMTLNEQTGTYEYWTPVYGSDFSSDGPITIEAEVYGYDGGVRDKNTDGGGVGLDPLKFVVNPTGSLPHVQAWVSPSGNDGSGVVNDSTRPFATMGKAIDAIRQHRSSLGLGNNADGGIVRLTPGHHTSSSGGVSGAIACDNEWVTITTAAGGSFDNTVILPGGIAAARKLCVRGVTLQGAGVLGISYDDRTQSHLWVDGCDLIGSGRGNPGAHPLQPEYLGLYYTDSSITQVHQATSGSKLCRNLAITTISDDAFQNVPLVINCTVDDMDPLGTGAHADLWQHGFGNPQNKVDDNVIVYNLIGTRLKYQSIFIRPDITSPPSMAQGMAFVNVYSEMTPDAAGWGGWGRQVDHLLWWHCTFAGKGMGFMSETYQGGPKQPCRIENISVKGCHFAFFGDGGAQLDWNEWDSNHFVDGSTTAGVNFTTGADLLDATGMPQNGSPLIDRIDAVVPVDAANNIRGSKSDVGAFER